MTEAKKLMTEELRQLKYSKPLLTIAIPTYNRARFLRELLSVLFDQLIAEPRVELIVSDNASSDETPAVVCESQKRGLQIRYIRNDTNLGADGNILQCFEQARGKYVWIFGDDDVVATGTIDKILPYLVDKDYDLVYVSAYPIECPDKPRTLKAPAAAIEIGDVEIFVTKVHVLLTFISSNIVNKDRVLAFSAQPLSPFRTLLGTSLVQLGWIYTALNGYERGLYVSERLVGGRSNNTGGYKVLQAFGPNLSDVTEKWLRDRVLQRLIINGALQTFWPAFLLNFRSLSDKFVQESAPDKILTPVFKKNFRYWLFVYPMLITPPAIAKCWLFVLRVLNKTDRLLGSVLMK